jgi:hypothetical protein
MLTFVFTMMTPATLERLYQRIKAPNFNGRYTPPSTLIDLINEAKSQGIFSALGASVQGREIGYIEIGSGDFKILAWSQMHGDESTSTRALVDLFMFLNQKKHQKDFVTEVLSTYRFRIIFQLNPDGAFAYSRENALGFDLNRDARTQRHPESKLLADLIAEYKPDLCLNCHDQRSLYSLSKSINPPHISFLSPAADEKLSQTPARIKAMEYIVSSQNFLRQLGFDKIGRYDESYCDRCFGDYLQSKKIPTILIESGHIIGDEPRDKSRFVVFAALIGILLHPLQQQLSQNKVLENYFDIPENLNILRDVVLKNVRYQGRLVDIGLQNRLILNQGKLKSEVYVHDITEPGAIIGYKTQDIKGQEILINSHENDFENKKIVSILLKKSSLLIKI